MQYWHKKKLIDGPLRKKVASIYRRAADRFQVSPLNFAEFATNFAIIYFTECPFSQTELEPAPSADPLSNLSEGSRFCRVEGKEVWRRRRNTIGTPFTPVASILAFRAIPVHIKNSTLMTSNIFSENGS